MSKGSRQRPVDREVFESNFDKIFGKLKPRPNCPFCGGSGVVQSDIGAPKPCPRCQ